MGLDRVWAKTCGACVYNGLLPRYDSGGRCRVFSHARGKTCQKLVMN
jgi:hypothetical protein